MDEKSENMPLVSRLYHLLLSNLLALRLQKLWAQPHRVDQIPFNVPHDMRHVRKHVRPILESEHLLQDIEPLGPLREVDQIRGREIPIIRRHGIRITVVDLRDLGEPHPDVRYTWALASPNRGCIRSKPVCRITEFQEIVEYGSLSRMSPCLVQARDGVARESVDDSMHRRNVVNQPAFLLIDRQLMPGLPILVGIMADLSTSYPKVDHLRSLRNMVEVQDAHLHPRRQFIVG